MMNYKSGKKGINVPKNIDSRGRTIILVFTMIFTAVALISAPISIASAQSIGNEKKTLRIGYFPNITHSQAVIGLNNGDYQKTLGDNVTVETFRFNAGPSAIESLLADRIDATYIGPNPAINGYLLTGGEDLRVISGAASGGASFIVRNDSGIETVNDLGGKKFASPQLGNTQDVALRKYLIDNGFNTVENGGNITVLPIANADILTVFLKKEIDGAWVPEPWATRLVQEADGKVFLDEKSLWPDGKFVTGNLIVRTDYLRDNPEIIKKLLEAHVEETLWINNNTAEAGKVFNSQLKKITGQEISENVLNKAYSNLEITYDPLKLTLFKSANDAYDLGFIEKGKDRPNLSGIYDTTLLNEVLAEKGLKSIDNTGAISNITNSTSSGEAITDIVA
ncbi:ABC transporter substrate-binding protein [Candidatus Nitrosocosmicus arcticus]|uniref:ABC-type nitrate/sulfonate/bicarbonate transport system, periplasmic component n=1 Tax=Candidatus Nitrosocosmicus arcticus TaxID=2035267 RepID=A0A557ST63_9ARCH|nr:ABC transporter substrate-binding protein [Candidatus Nitrosocosmicus arcticus]TVP39806.1 ABC-type nitrate/sulfonate/bicarbonate transport system, periplasmic component [Candidatus Nitrosocosmicus arcticus]